VVEESRTCALSQAKVDYLPIAGAISSRALGEDEVDREAVLVALRAFSEARSRSRSTGSSVARAPTEALVNALSMMSPYGSKEKQALLEAPDLKTRAEPAGRHHRNRTVRAGRRRRHHHAIGLAMPDTPERSASRVIDPKFLELLVCPVSKTALEYDAVRQELVSPAGRLAYPIRDGIPIMLADEARKLDES
jgi:uncharacterized protein YbaR (Trm112 family)